jgi:hypothetical protein
MIAVGHFVPFWVLKFSEFKHLNDSIKCREIKGDSIRFDHAQMVHNLCKREEGEALKVGW